MTILVGGCYSAVLTIMIPLSQSDVFLLFVSAVLYCSDIVGHYDVGVSFRFSSVVVKCCTCCSDNVVMISVSCIFCSAFYLMSVESLILTL